MNWRHPVPDKGWSGRFGCLVHPLLAENAHFTARYPDGEQIWPFSLMYVTMVYFYGVELIIKGTTHKDCR